MAPLPPRCHLPKQTLFNAYADIMPQEKGSRRTVYRPAKTLQFVRLAPVQRERHGDESHKVWSGGPMPAWETYGGRVRRRPCRLRLVSAELYVLRRSRITADQVSQGGQGSYTVGCGGLPYWSI